jgi:membrane dipeptidase
MNAKPRSRGSARAAQRARSASHLERAGRIKRTSGASAAADSKAPREARALYEQSLIWDMVWPLADFAGNAWSSLDRFRAAGYDVLSVTLAGDNHNASQALEMVAAARRYIFSRPDDLLLVTSVADAHRAQREGKLGVALHFEGTRCFERNPDLIEAFYALGIRHTLLAFNQTNSCGGGCAEASDGGLSRFGRSLIAQMNRIGMLLDLSHTGRRTSLEALEVTTQPAVFTHSNCDAVHPHFRNLTDEQIRACAATGGLVGVSGSSAYLGDPKASSSAVFRHLDHIVQRVGPAHVGLGLDIVFDAKRLSDWMRLRPDEWPGVENPNWPGVRYAMPEQLVELTGLMLEHGYSKADVQAILGGNYVRICEKVWR